VLDLSRVPQDMVTILTPSLRADRCATIAAHGCRRSGQPARSASGQRALSHSRDPLAYVGTTPLTGNRPAMEMCKASDIVLDLMLLLFSPEQAEILESGTKILLAVEPPEIWRAWCRPRRTARREGRGRADRTLAHHARHLRRRDRPHLPARPVSGRPEYGFVDEPGRWDHWPSGFVLTWPNEGAVNGTIVIDGDILLPQKSYAADPVKLTVRDGYVTAIEGGLDADLLRDYMEAFDDPEGYAISHIGWACNSGRAGRPWRFTTANRRSAWMRAPLPATSCSPRAEHRSRRRAQHRLPYRHSLAPLHRAAGRHHGGREWPPGGGPRPKAQQ
jgi:2,5-dihydroxypyridine 5,6-dioxygenase